MELRPTSQPAPGVPHLLEKPYQVRVITFAENCGWEVFHHGDSRKQVRPGVFVGDIQARGFPDLVLVRERVLYRELKQDGEYLDPWQRYWAARLEAAGCDYDLWRPADWDTIVQPFLESGRLEWLDHLAKNPDLERPLPGRLQSRRR